MSAPFFTRRFFLDNVRTRAQGRGGEFFVGTFRSFWVSKSNKASFDADIVINTTNNTDRGLPLRLNQCQAFGEKVDDACIEVSVAQPGVWIDITFSQEEVLSVGSVVVDLSGLVVISEGSSHSSSAVSVTSTPTEIISASDARASVTLQNKSTGSVWVGNPSELSEGTYQNICIEFKSGEVMEWKNSAALYARTSTGTAIISVMQELK